MYCTVRSTYIQYLHTGLRDNSGRGRQMFVSWTLSSMSPLCLASTGILVCHFTSCNGAGLILTVLLLYHPAPWREAG